jgi:hypothetical protein
MESGKIKVIGKVYGNMKNKLGKVSLGTKASNLCQKGR